MVIYAVFIIIVFGLLCFVKKDKYNIWDFIVIAVLVCFSGFRYRVGTDYAMYEKIYMNMDMIPATLFRTGIGYYYITGFLHKLIPSTAVPMFFIISFLTNTLIYKFCKEKSDNPGLSIFMYICLGFYPGSFNIFRQMLSLALTLYSYKFLEPKKYFRYAIFCVLAICIHQSSIFIIGMMIIFNKIWRKKLNAKILFAIGLGMLVIYQTIYKFLIVNIGFISIYNNTEQYVAGLGTYLQILIYGFLFVLININKDIIIQKNARNLEYINLFSISFIMMLLGIKNTLFMRMATYLNIFIILLIPELYNIYKLKDKKIEKIFLYLCCIIYFFVYINSFGDVVPYHSIFEIK